MKIDKRYVVGTIFLIPMLPFVIAGFLGWWLVMYVKAGAEVGEMVYEWLNEKLEG